MNYDCNNNQNHCGYERHEDHCSCERQSNCGCESQRHCSCERHDDPCDCECKKCKKDCECRIVNTSNGKVIYFFDN